MHCTVQSTGAQRIVFVFGLESAVQAILHTLTCPLEPLDSCLAALDSASIVMCETHPGSIWSLVSSGTDVSRLDAVLMDVRTVVVMEEINDSFGHDR